MGKSKSVYLNDAQEEWAKRNIKRGEFSDYVGLKIDQDIKQQNIEKTLQISVEEKTKLATLQDMTIIITGAIFFAYSFSYYVFGVESIPKDFFIFSIVGITIELLMFFAILNIVNRKKKEVKEDEHTNICSNTAIESRSNNRIV